MILSNFIGKHRDELISRCRGKVAQRSGPGPAAYQIEHGVPTFLDQLCEELLVGPSPTPEIVRSAMKNGRGLLRQGFTISQVVHGYGDVCQAVTELAVELAVPISADDFRTLNRCLDDAIAGAVTAYANEQDLTRAGESNTVRNLAEVALTGLEALRAGNAGFAGSTGELVQRSLKAIHAVAHRQYTEIVPPSDRG
jgi:hypothetical protein